VKIQIGENARQKEHTEDLLLRDKLFQFPTQKNLTSKLSDGPVVGEQEVRMVTVQDNTVTLWYCIRVIRLCFLHKTNDTAKIKQLTATQHTECD